MNCKYLCWKPFSTKYVLKSSAQFLKNIIFAESDNFGSTDSEVKKILTLHLPISEYDTLGSDSEVDSRQINNQELVSFRHIGPHRGEIYLPHLL